VSQVSLSAACCQYMGPYRNKVVAGIVLKLFCIPASGRIRVWSKPFYYTPTGRLAFLDGPGLFEGMRKESLNQFKNDYFDRVYCMYSLEQDFEAAQKKFLQCVHRRMLRTMPPEKFCFLNRRLYVGL
jgi:hypothetical protein